MNYTSLLLIDDDKDDQLLFSEAIREIDTTLQYEMVLDGNIALKKLENTHTLPELIFLDLNMPNMHGFECLKKIKERPSMRAIPIIIFTTSNNPRDIIMAKQLGAAAYCCKPMHFRELCKILKNVLDGVFNIGNVKDFQVIE